MGREILTDTNIGFGFKVEEGEARLSDQPAARGKGQCPDKSVAEETIASMTAVSYVLVTLIGVVVSGVVYLVVQFL